MTFAIETFCDNGYNANTYLVFNEKSCIIIDPANNVNTLKKYIDNREVLAILITHGHYDHFKDVLSVLKNYNCKVYLHKNAYNKMKDINLSCAKLFMVNDGTIIDEEKIVFVSEGKNLILNDFNIKCMYLPGHTDCSIGYLINNNLFIGDVLFENSIGRYDLPTGNYLALSNTLSKIKKLKDNFVIYPGHDNSFLLKDAKTNNYYLNKIN